MNEKEMKTEIHKLTKKKNRLEFQLKILKAGRPRSLFKDEKFLKS